MRCSRCNRSISRAKNEGLVAGRGRCARDERARARSGGALRGLSAASRRVQCGRFRRPDPPAGLPCSTPMPMRALRGSERIRHLLVDECQDTNGAQYRLLKLLAGERGMFTAVGDDDQAIYTWRGANPENLAELSRDYPGLKVIKLEQNYRCAQRVLRAANALIANNAHVFDKKLWSEQHEGAPLRIVECRDDEHEAECTAVGDRASGRQAQGALARVRRALSRQPSVAAARKGAAARARSVSRDRRHGVSRSRRGQGSDRIPAPDQQRRRRRGVPARR